MLLSLVNESGAKIIYFLGMSKNAGKTMAFNSLIKEATLKKICLGLTSFGWDGELEDRIFQHAKPRIIIPKMSLCATSQAILEKSTINNTITYKTKYKSLFGPVCISRFLEEGEIELAGPIWGNQVSEITNQLIRQGAELILVDGAIDRRSAASPVFSDGTILATGAVLNRDMNVVVERTSQLATQLLLPGISNPNINKIAKEIIAKKETAAITKNNQIFYLNKETLLKNTHDFIKNIPIETTYLIFGGSLQSHLFAQVSSRLNISNMTIIAHDATKIFQKEGELKKFLASGGCLEVLYPVKLIAITANPVSPLGWKFPPEKFVESLAKTIPGITVCDVVSGYFSKT